MQFNTKSERDEWVRKEVAQAQRTVAQKRENADAAQQQLAAAQAEAQEAEGRAEEVAGLLGESEEGAKLALQQQEALLGERNGLQNQQRELFQREAELATWVLLM